MDINGDSYDSQKFGLITLIPKKDKSKEYIKTWRPISLLNIIYKLGSAAIAERIKNVLPSLVSMDQNGLIQGRSIGNNIRLIYDIYIESLMSCHLLLNLLHELANMILCEALTKQYIYIYIKVKM